jgi:hypothetical protein
LLWKATARTGVRQQKSHLSPVATKAFKVLFLAANPLSMDRLRLDEEIRAIDLALRQTELRDRIVLVSHWATRISDLQEVLLRHEPIIVHFSGHGNLAGEIVLVDERGNAAPVALAALSDLFGILKASIRCVVLNACYAEEQAQRIAQHVNAVIGMSSAVEDRDAINFAVAFYRALGYRRDLSMAFQLGHVEVNLNQPGQENAPILLAERIDPARYYCFE